MKNAIGAIIVIAILVGGVYYFKGAEKEKTADTTPVESQTESMSDVSPSMEEEEGTVYTIEDNSTVTYAAQKKFLGKETQVVEGVTSDVTGSIIINADTDEGTIMASAKASIEPNFKSDSSKRDEDVKNMFGEAIRITLPKRSFDKEDASNLTEELPLEVTMNGETRTLIFSVTVTDSGDTLRITGSSEVSMKDFGMEAPSLINVYTVDDVIGLTFDVTAKKS